MAVIQPSSLSAVLLIIISVTCSNVVCHGSMLGERLCSIVTTHFNSTTNLCRVCNNCTNNISSSHLSNCSLVNCSCPSEHFYNATTSTCQRCQTCTGLKEQTNTSQCTAITDRVCQCPARYWTSQTTGTCQIDCTYCPSIHDCNRLENKCICPRCKAGRFCELLDTSDPTCNTPTDTTPNTRTSRPTPTEETPNGFSPVLSALIAVGAVFGIITFSACFVILGLVASCNRTNYDTSSNTSNTSDSSNRDRTYFEGTVGNPGPSGSLASLYINGYSPSPTQEYRTSLDLLKHSNSSLYSNSWNTIKGSPRSDRSNSIPTSSFNNRRIDRVWTPV